MKYTGKVISAILVLVMLLAAFAGCAAEQEEKGTDGSVETGTQSIPPKKAHLRSSRRQSLPLNKIIMMIPYIFNPWEFIGI